MVKEYDVNKLKELIDSKDVNAIVSFMKEYNLILKGNNIESIDKNEFTKQKDFLDLKQYVRKIQLNSSYGASLQGSSIFYDFRLGTSTTLSGRQVVKHLTSKANELLCGKYEVIGYCAQYNDTDSVYCYIDNPYFKAFHPEFVMSKDNLIDLSNNVTKQVNESFPPHMRKIFHCNEERSNRASAAKECVSERGLFVAKKRYAMLVYEHDGFRKDVEESGEMKIMGLQFKRADCHKKVKELLYNMLESLLEYGEKERLVAIVRDFAQNEWSKLEPWRKGKPQACNKLTFYEEEYKKTGKCAVSQVLASINWNRLIDMNNDKKTTKILDGNKVIVCKLKKNNPYGMEKVAYPVDLTKFPKWFKELPFDEQSMKDSIVDKTIETIFGVTGWDLTMEKALRVDDDMDGFISFDV